MSLLTQIEFKHNSLKNWSILCLSEMNPAICTAALPCCRMDSLFAGVSTSVSTLLGFLFGTEGESVFYCEVKQKGLLQKTKKKKKNPNISSFNFKQNDDPCPGFSHSDRCHKLLHDILLLSRTLCLWSLAQEILQERSLAPSCVGAWD